MTLNGHRLLSRLAVNFTPGLAFSRLRSRLSRDFWGDSGLAFSLRSCSFVQFLHFCYVFAFLTFFVNIFYIEKKFRAYRKFYQELREALLKPSQKQIYRPHANFGFVVVCLVSLVWCDHTVELKLNKIRSFSLFSISPVLAELRLQN